MRCKKRCKFNRGRKVPFLALFINDIVVQIWLSPLHENHQIDGSFFYFVVNIDIFYYNIYYIYEFSLYIYHGGDNL